MVVLDGLSTKAMSSRTVMIKISRFYFFFLLKGYLKQEFFFTTCALQAADVDLKIIITHNT